MPEIPFEEMVAISLELRPRFIGFSCALPHSVPVATDLILHLRERLSPQFSAGYLLAGFAFRHGAGDVASGPTPGIEIVTDLEYFSAH